MELARWCGKPTFVYAQGIGPVNRKMFQPFIARAFKKAAYVSVRDEESAILLRRYGVPQESIEIVPDPVMGLPSAEGFEGAVDGDDVHESSAGRTPLDGEPGLAATAAEQDTPPVVGVSVRFWRSDRADLVRTAAALEALAGRHAVRLRFLPFHHGADEDASRYVMERLAGSGVPATLAPAHDDPQLMLREVGRCALLIGMRLHSLIFAANQEIPLLGLSYDPKINQFLGRIGQRAVGTTDDLDPAELADQATKLLLDPSTFHQASLDKIVGLKVEAARPAQQIINYIRNKYRLESDNQ
jgi:polysaccharide pyruvyl transferase WcaK-like protein